MNLVEKILKEHTIEGDLKEGKHIGIRIDQTLTQDATGTMVYLQFEAMGMAEVKTELSVSYVDHNTLQMGFENSDDHVYLQDVAAKYGIIYSRCGNGICHQVHLERFARPGRTLLGSDSHTPTAGGIGSLAMGAGGIDVAAAMGGAPYFIQVPKVINVILSGKLHPGVSAKDIILKVLSILTTKGNVGTVVEYSGDALKNLTVPERATITNMGAELGVTSSVFPSDEQTRLFLKAQNREGDFVVLTPDPDACYFKTVEIDLGKLIPMVATPHSPDQVKPVRELSDLSVDQVCIGSCTNASYKDIVTVAEILNEGTVHPNISLVVVPGSKQVWEMADEAGALRKLVAAGARIMEPACGFCIGMGQAPISAGISIRTNNRNFEGRSGTKDAQVYLVSAETAAITALTGKLTDPSQWKTLPSVEMPKKFKINDNMIVNPPADGAQTIIRRGPNIGDPPGIEAFPDNFQGRVTIILGDKITTDHIMPAGPRLKFRSNIKTYSQYVFEGLDPEFHKKCLQNREKGFWSVIVAGQSYGQGSSREHAALCPAHLGVRIVLAGSIERIHASNLINFGILPLSFEKLGHKDIFTRGDRIDIAHVRKNILEGKPLVIRNETRGEEITLISDLTERQKQILLAGGLLNYIKGGFS